ncbi:hypothetical protein CPLU01_10673 [Colletotrichum plurivorum]|uniref:Uncharacterized protein n=1 Tax=Colletotrichum plurivorum TaxID=2175906 RepID=A0A8H6K401_9PEZI|nr:hypothetical protein CPLU01_10673 [Colletotrichum plurivorum]
MLSSGAGPVALSWASSVGDGTVRTLGPHPPRFQAVWPVARRSSHICAHHSRGASDGAVRSTIPQARLRVQPPGLVWPPTLACCFPLRRDLAVARVNCASDRAGDVTSSVRSSQGACARAAHKNTEQHAEKHAAKAAALSGQMDTSFRLRSGGRAHPFPSFNFALERNTECVQRHLVPATRQIFVNQTRPAPGGIDVDLDLGLYSPAARAQRRLAHRDPPGPFSEYLRHHLTKLPAAVCRPLRRAGHRRRQVHPHPPGALGSLLSEQAPCAQSPCRIGDQAECTAKCNPPKAGKRPASTCHISPDPLGFGFAADSPRCHDDAAAVADGRARPSPSFCLCRGPLRRTGLKDPTALARPPGSARVFEETRTGQIAGSATAAQGNNFFGGGGGAVRRHMSEVARRKRAAKMFVLQMLPQGLGALEPRKRGPALKDAILVEPRMFSE